MRIIIVRHGEPNYEKDCLTPLGIRQAKAAAVRLKGEGIEEIFSSPMGRARQTAQETADLLKKKHCDLVVCISHLGWEEKGMGDQEVISRTRGIDLVLGGHSHTYFRQLRYVDNLDGKPVADDQNGKSGIYIGKMKITLEE